MADDAPPPDITLHAALVIDNGKYGPPPQLPAITLAKMEQLNRIASDFI